MRRLSVYIATFALAIVPVSAFALSQPSDVLGALFDGKPKNFSVQIHSKAGDAHMSMWVAGETEENDLSRMKTKMRATIDVERDGGWTRTRLKMRIYQKHFYMLVEGIDGDYAQDPTLAYLSTLRGQWIKVPLDEAWFSQWLANRKGVGMDHEYMVEHTQFGAGHAYSVKLKDGFADSINGLLHQDSMGLVPLVEEPSANIHVKMDTNDEGQFRYSKFYMSQMGDMAQFSLVIQGESKRQYSPVYLEVPRDTIYTDLMQHMPWHWLSLDQPVFQYEVEEAAPVLEEWKGGTSEPFQLDDGYYEDSSDDMEMMDDPQPVKVNRRSLNRSFDRQPEVQERYTGAKQSRRHLRSAVESQQINRKINRLQETQKLIPVRRVDERPAHTRTSVPEGTTVPVREAPEEAEEEGEPASSYHQDNLEINEEGDLQSKEGQFVAPQAAVKTRPSSRQLREADEQVKERRRNRGMRQIRQSGSYRSSTESHEGDFRPNTRSTQQNVNDQLEDRANLKLGNPDVDVQQIQNLYEQRTIEE